MDNGVNTGSQVSWFVGATFGTNDQVPRFLAEGIWELRNPTENEASLVKSMQVGERIAIKAAYTRKRGLPFDGKGRTASVMSIKAIGTITANPGDGERVQVCWSPQQEVREWYFYTYRPTVWRVRPGDWMADGLIAFAFDGQPQDIERFRNDPYWRERFGTVAPDRQRFAWTKFYEAIADKLLAYRGNRTALIEGIRELSLRVDGLGHLTDDRYTDGSTGFVRDICPFTTMGLFNRGTTDANRKIIAAELARFLEVEEPVPETFEGISLLNNLKSWYFGYENERPVEQIDALWRVFEAGIRFADGDDEGLRDEFVAAFDAAREYRNVAWNLTFGLYWIRPWAFVSLEGTSRLYMREKLALDIGKQATNGRLDAVDYLALMSVLESRFHEAGYPVHSFPELSLEAWLYARPTGEGLSSGGDDTSAALDAEQATGDVVATWSAAPIVPYSVADILNDGCFLGQGEIERLLERLRSKKNLILQGPPGTGKTWLAKRLAFALMGEKDERRIRAVQFHPNLSYEDFIRGWRPTGDGRLSLADGIFMEAIRAAAREPSSSFVVVIEEINRGNPAQVFGELLTLLEAGKRTPSEAIELCYPDGDGKRRPVHVPENLHVIGTMNIADRSLALVDLALRRRFAFVSLEPRLGKVWRDWVVRVRGLDEALAADIERRMLELNAQIASDARLGRQFCIGHSYVTPTGRLEAGGTVDWFRQVVETEIEPLLEEYWFDAQDEARKAGERLMQGWP